MIHIMRDAQHAGADLIWIGQQLVLLTATSCGLPAGEHPPACLSTFSVCEGKLLALRIGSVHATENLLDEDALVHEPGQAVLGHCSSSSCSRTRTLS